MICGLSLTTILLGLFWLSGFATIGFAALASPALCLLALAAMIYLGGCVMQLPESAPPPASDNPESIGRSSRPPRDSRWARSAI